MKAARAVLVLAFLAGAMVAGCAGGGVPPMRLDRAAGESSLASGGVCSSTTPPPTPSPAAQPATSAKPELFGLIDIGQVSADNMPEPPPNTLYYVCQRRPEIAGIVVNDTWQNLQPGGSGTLQTGPIDRALGQIRAYNATSKQPLGVRLRIWAGINAPAWAMSLAGGPFTICDGNAVPNSPSPSPAADARTTPSPSPCPSVAQRSLGAFWSPAYAAAWDTLQQQLAKRYDADPLVDEVTVSSCSSLTNEPFVQPEDAFSRDAIQAGGYKDGLYRECLAKAIARDYAPYWHKTRIVYSFNPFRKIDDVPPQTDLPFTESVIDRCRAVIGMRCGLQNETMAKYTPPPSPLPSQTPSVAQSYYLMWAYMQSKGGEITFQTAAPPNLLSAWGSNVAGWEQALALAARYGATSVELFAPKGQPCRAPSRAWWAGYTCFTRGTLARWQSALVH